MCDVDRRLVAWLDRELPEDEAAEVERHVKTCPECRSRAEAYERASIAFNAYCDALGAASARQKTVRPKLAAAVAVAAVWALALLAQYTRTRVTQPRPHGSAPETTVADAPLVQGVTAAMRPSEVHPIKDSSVKKARRRNVVAPVEEQDVHPFRAGPAIQVTIPAEAVLPPGAAPAGENFVVDFRIGPDGSAEEIRLRTQLTGFERRATQP